MKIQGLNFSKINAYQNQIQNQKHHDKSLKQKADQINISNEAKSLQENQQLTSERKTEIQKLKTAIKTGEYEKNYQEMASKLLKYRTNES